jgi:signal transduction histidine kinase
VATLARRQERELRAWLYPDREPAAEGTLADAVNVAAAEMEELHGVRVEVVRTGDAPLDERTSALVLAAREAMANASRHSGAAEVSVFLDADARRVALYSSAPASAASSGPPSRSSARPARLPRPCR